MLKMNNILSYWFPNFRLFINMFYGIIANEIDSVETFMLLTQSLVMNTLGLKLGSWLKIEQMQKTIRDSIDNTPAQVFIIFIILL